MDKLQGPMQYGMAHAKVVESPPAVTVIPPGGSRRGRQISEGTVKLAKQLWQAITNNPGISQVNLVRSVGAVKQNVGLLVRWMEAQGQLRVERAVWAQSKIFPTGKNLTLDLNVPLCLRPSEKANKALAKAAQAHRRLIKPSPKAPAPSVATREDLQALHSSHGVDLTAVPKELASLPLARLKVLQSYLNALFK